MPEHDTVLAVLQSGIALAGLLLIFSGFLFTKAASFDTKRGDKFRRLAKATLIPVLAALVLTWIGIDALDAPQGWEAAHLVLGFRITVGITAVFAVVGVLLGSP